MCGMQAGEAEDGVQAARCAELKEKTHGPVEVFGVQSQTIIGGSSIDRLCIKTVSEHASHTRNPKGGVAPAMGGPYANSGV